MAQAQTHTESPQPPQHQDRQPGIESDMVPRPQAEDRDSRGSGKLQGKVALITGGDSGIGRAVAIAFAKEGADVAIVYLNEHGDAQETRALVEKEGRRCMAIAGDVGDERFCQQAVQDTIRDLGGLMSWSIMPPSSIRKRALSRLPASSSSAPSAPISSPTSI